MSPNAIKKSKYKQNVYKTFIHRLWLFFPVAVIFTGMWNSLIPTITTAAIANHPSSITSEIPPVQNIWTPGFSVSATLNLSVSTIDNIKKARVAYEAGLLTYEQAKQRLELQVRKLFYQIILMESGRELAERSFANAQVRYEQSASLAQAGQASRLDEMAARVDMENKPPNMRSAETLRDREGRITQYRRIIEQTQEAIATLRLNVELARTTYALYEEAYRSGAVDYQRLRDADDSLLLAQNRVQQEQYNLISAILDLEKELNIPFGTIR